jgi:hypothetical protein
MPSLGAGMCLAPADGCGWNKNKQWDGARITAFLAWYALSTIV